MINNETLNVCKENPRQISFGMLICSWLDFVLPFKTAHLLPRSAKKYFIMMNSMMHKKYINQMAKNYAFLNKKYDL